MYKKQCGEYAYWCQGEGFKKAFYRIRRVIYAAPRVILFCFYLILMSTAIYYKKRRTTTRNVVTKYIKDRFCFGKVVFCPFVCREMAVLTDSIVILRLSLLQSETCEVYMPSLDFHIAAGTLGGRFTTLEGLLCNIKDQVRGTHLT